MGMTSLSKRRNAVCGGQDRGGSKLSSVLTTHHTLHRSSPKRRKTNCPELSAISPQDTGLKSAGHRSEISGLGPRTVLTASLSRRPVFAFRALKWCLTQRGPPRT